MRIFSQLIQEGNYSAEELLQSDITKYINKVKKSLGVDVQKAIYMASKYHLDRDQLDEIRKANKSGLKGISIRMAVPLEDIQGLWDLFKSMKGNYRIMPQYLTRQEREMVEMGKLAMDDLTIDLHTPAGRNAVAKMYTPLVYKIVQQELPKYPNMDRSEMISSGLLGLSNAMDDWKRPGTTDKPTVPFKTYAGYRILQQIQNDANSVYQVLSGRNQYNIKKDAEKYGAGILRATSLDGLTKDRDADDFSQDRIAALGVADRPDSAQEEKKWNQLFKQLDNKFSQRDTDIFYRYFGVNGRKKESGVDIARSYGMTPVNLNNSVLRKILKYIRDNRTLRDIMQDIRDIYTESIMVGMVGMNRSQIMEALISDDIYILLVESTQWDNKNKFITAIHRSLDPFRANRKNMDILVGVITGEFDDIDGRVRKEGGLIRQFLSQLYPTQSFQGYTDGDIIEYVTILQEYCHKYHLDKEYFISKN